MQLRRQAWIILRALVVFEEGRDLGVAGVDVRGDAA
jgi:hypothetical protein